MPGMNLTRQEAAERAGVLSVDSYEIELDLTTAETTFDSTTVLRFACSEPGLTTFVDLVATAVASIELNGTAVDPATAFDGTRITLDGLAETNVLRVVATCAYSRTGQGLHRFVDPVDGEVYTYTQFETADARRVFACFEQPDLKSTYALTVTAPAGWQVVSNAATPTPVEVSDGVARWAFAPTRLMSTYIVALVAGPYHVVRDMYTGSHGSVPLGVFCRQSLAAHLDADEIFTVTKQGFGFFETLFDYPYPFGKYDQLFVPEYNAGAMENAGAVTFRDEYVFRSRETDAAYERRAETILHELAHMWFGDLVTMRWWDDLWLNESFATYASVLCQAEVTRWPDAWTTFVNVEKNWAYRQDQLPSTHPISADIRDLEDVEVNFDGITYAKGASVLKQLVAWVGQDHFFEGLRRYFKRHEWSNTTLSDLLAVLSETSGRDLESWSKEWLETAGVTTLRPDFEVDSHGAFSRFSVLQEAPESQPSLRSHRLAIGFYDRTVEGLVRRDRVELDIAGERTDVPAMVGMAQPDLLLLNDDDLAYTKIRLDDRSLETLLTSIHQFPASLPRALCWGAAWDMCRDAELRTRDFVRLVLEGIGAESDAMALQHLLRVTGAAVRTYSEPANRDTLARQWADGLLELVRTAEPGSDEQLSFVRGFATAACTDEHAAVLAGWLDGTDVPAGLEVDTDLRWSLVGRLAALGSMDLDGIEAELARDETITGQHQAAYARAARPLAEAKEAAWELAVERADTPAITQLHIILGFNQPAQEELLRPHAARYFDVIDEMWADRAHEVAQNAVQGLFPYHLVDQSTVDLTDEWLARPGHAPAVQRLVSEHRDGLARALRCQERDARA